MTDREKVIKGLECCSAMSGDECRRCPYSSECLNENWPVGMSHLANDALWLLKTDGCENCAMAVEDRQMIVRCKDCKHLFDGEHTENCCDVLMEKAGWLKEISVSTDWFCADGEKR